MKEQQHSQGRGKACLEECACKAVIWCLAASERLGETLGAVSPLLVVIVVDANSQ